MIAFVVTGAGAKSAIRADSRVSAGQRKWNDALREFKSSFAAHEEDGRSPAAGRP